MPIKPHISTLKILSFIDSLSTKATAPLHKASKKYLGQFQNALFPWHSVRYPVCIPKAFVILQVPRVISAQSFFVRIYRTVSKNSLRLVDRNERILARRLIHPFVERRQMHRLKQPQRPNHRRRGKTSYFLSETRHVQHCLVVLFHRVKLFRPYVERVVYKLTVHGCACVYGLAQVMDIEQLISVLSTANHGKSLAVLSPIVKQGENAQPLWPDK